MSSTQHPEICIKNVSKPTQKSRTKIVVLKSNQIHIETIHDMLHIDHISYPRIAQIKAIIALSHCMDTKFQNTHIGRASMTERL